MDIYKHRTIYKVKKEFPEDEITKEYHEISRKPIHPLKTPKIECTGPTDKTVQPKDNFLNKPLKMGPKHKILKNNPPKLLLKNNNQIQPNKTEVSTRTTTCENLAVSDVTNLLSNESLSKNSKVIVSNGNIESLHDCQTEPPKSIFKALSNNSCKELPSGTSEIREHPLSFRGAGFLHAQVHSNSVLQSLLKDIISLNNKKDDINEDTISKEIAKLRSKNNLPSLNAEVPIILDDSDYSEGSEGESSYYDSKVSENYGKDSGYDNESQYSGSIDDDNNSTLIVQDSLGNQAEKSLVIAEPEYIDLDNYFGRKGKITLIRGSLEDLKTVPKPENESALNFNGLTCPICKKTLKSRKTYRHHTKNGTGCVKKPSNNYRLFSCKSCNFFGSKEGFLKHTHEKNPNKRQNDYKTTINDNTVPSISCKKCNLSFVNTVSLQRHTTTNHKRTSCLFCDFSSENLTECNLHIASKHSKRVQTESCSSDSDSLQIVEVD